MTPSSSQRFSSYNASHLVNGRGTAASGEKNFISGIKWMDV